MSNVLNDLIVTDAAGFSPGDSLSLGSGLIGVSDSAIGTETGLPGRLSVGDDFVMDGIDGAVTGLSTLTADVTYSSALGGSVTATMALLVISVTDNVSGVTTQMLVPLDSNGDLMRISSIDIVATDTNPGMSDIAFSNIASDDSVTLAEAWAMRKSQPLPVTFQ